MNSQVRKPQSAVRTGPKPVRLLWVTGFCALLLSSCGLEAPESPHWTVSLKAPIAHGTVDGPYIVENAGIDVLHWDPDSGLIWHVEELLDTIAAHEALTLSAFSDSAAVAIDDFTLAEGTETAVTIRLDELHPAPVGFIAAFSGSAQRELPPVATIDSASVSSGLLKLELKNDLGIALDSIEVLLSNDGDASPFATVLIPGPVANGDSAFGTADLAGQTLEDHWRFNLRFFTPGGTILSASDKEATLIASLPDGVTAQSARAVVDPLSSAQQTAVILTGDHALQSLAIAAGSLALAWENSSSVALQIAWSSPDITSSGVPLAGSITLAPGAHDARAIDLAGYQYQAATPSAARFDLQVTSPGSNGAKVTIEQNDGISLVVSTSEITATAASGVLGALSYSTGELSTAIDWDRGIEAAGFDEWQAWLEVTTTLPVATTVDGRVTTNTGLDLDLSGAIQPATNGTPTTSLIPLQTSGTTLHPLPQTITFAGTLSYGGGETSVAITPQDFFAARVIMTAASNLYLDGVTIDEEVRAVELLTDTDEHHGRLIAGTMRLTASNRFPVGATITINLADNATTLAAAPALTYGPSVLQAAVTDAHGYAVAPVGSELTFAITPADVYLFEGDSLWVSVSITLDGPGGAVPARFSPSDFLEWSAVGELEVLAGEREGN